MRSHHAIWIAAALVTGLAAPAASAPGESPAEAPWPGAAAAEAPASGIAGSASTDGVTAAAATAPLLITYQGRFTTVSGTPLSGPISLIFRMYDAATGGSVIWTETHSSVTLQDGVGTVLLGSLVTFPFEAFTASSRYLAIVVNDGAEMSPRLRLTSVPFALQAEKLGGKGADDFELKGSVAALMVDDGNPPNQGSNRVHWNNLTGMPAGFADGTDTGVNDHGQLTGLLDDDHPQYAQKVELVNSSGQGPNTGKNIVHWENLVGVPSGFADATDNQGGVADHGELTGLSDDDHPQYALDTDLAAHDTSATAHPGLIRQADLASHEANPSAHHTKTVDASELTTGTLAAARLPENGITGAHVQDGALSGSDLAAGSVAGDRLTAASVPGDRLAAGAVGTAQLALDAVTSARIQNGTILAVDLAAGSVDSVALATAGVDSTSLATGAVNGRVVRDGSLTGIDFAPGSFSATEIGDMPGGTYSGAAGTVSLGVAPVTVLTRTITVPADGYILAIGSGEGCIEATSSGSELVLSFSVSTEGGSLDSIARLNYRTLGIMGVRQCAPLFSQRLYPVQKGFVTIYLVAQGATGADMDVSSLGLSLLFFTNQY